MNTTRRRMRNGTCSWPGAKLVERTGKGLSLTVADQVGITHLAALSDRDCPRYRRSPESATGKRKQSLRGPRELHAVNMLNELDLAAETVDILGDSAEDLKAVMSESGHDLTLFDLSAVMDEL